MSNIRQFIYDFPRITATAVDTENGFLWIAFSKSSDGKVHLYQTAIGDPSQIYSDVQISDVESIIDLKIDNTNGFIFALYNSSTKLISHFDLLFPLSEVSVTKNKPFGIPIPIAFDTNGSDIFILLPDSSGGITAKILVYDINLDNLTEVVDTNNLLESSETLWEVSSMTIDANDNLWLVTHTNPVKLARVWFASGGWNMRITSIS